MRHSSITNVVSAWEKFWAGTGMRSLCVACWQGEFSHNKGCCQGCEHLTDTGCKGKPIACAMWSCHSLDRMLEDSTKTFIGSMYHALAFADMTRGYRTSAYKAEVAWNVSPLEAAKLNGIAFMLEVGAEVYKNSANRKPLYQIQL